MLVHLVGTYASQAGILSGLLGPEYNFALMAALPAEGPIHTDVLVVGGMSLEHLMRSPK